MCIKWLLLNVLGTVLLRVGRRSRHRTRLPERRTSVGSGKVLQDQQGGAHYQHGKQHNKNILYL